MPKIIKQKGKGIEDDRCGIYFSPSYVIRLNNASRDSLNDPEYVSVEINKEKIVITPGCVEDFKLSRGTTGRYISGSRIMRNFFNIPTKTKLYGIFDGKSIIFDVPSEYLKEENP